MENFSYISFILLIPLAIFIITGLFGKKFPQFSGILGTAGLLACTALAYFAAYQYFFVIGRTDGIFQPLITFQHTWLSFGKSVMLHSPLPVGEGLGGEGLSIDFGIMLDPISVMMLVVVTTVSLMVHLYSIGYMRGEERYSTYFSFLSLFSFSMLGLVVATNIFEMYIFWELVGISSYLLIGFYFSKPSAVAAAKKAFIVTRFADLGFLAGILILSYYSGSLDFQTIIQRMTDYDGSIFLNANTSSFLGLSALTWALCLIFIGGAGKSAMFPLHIWLPDAMEGPTPVSALIHAATMVVAGVFLVARLFPVYSQVPVALDLVAYIGVFSAFFAAVIACTQTDIKRVLAYSTISQIGFMMFALGVSGYWKEEGLGYSASLFHLFTHAMFKALLFLGAGAVIHHIHSNEMNDMGGLRKKMPLTHAVFLIACLAISGIPPFSGFYSKEEILTAALQHNKLIYAVGLLTAGLTAFYMFRLYFSVFWNKAPLHPRLQSIEEKDGGQVSPKGREFPSLREGLGMGIPLLFLGIATIGVGFIPFSKYISADGISFETEFHLIPTILAVGAGLLGIFVAIILYARKNSKPEIISQSLGNFYHSVYQKFYIDEIYLFVTRKIVFNLISAPSAWFDRNIVDGFINMLSVTTENFSDGIKTIQSGKIADYVLWFFAGAILLSVFVIYVL